jgi:hypothetical protein
MGDQKQPPPPPQPQVVPKNEGRGVMPVPPTSVSTDASVATAEEEIGRLTLRTV